VNRTTLWLLHISNLLASGTGILYLFTHYLLTPSDPFRLIHPLDPWAQGLHVLLSPLLVFSVGVIFFGHAISNLKSERKRISGWILLFGFFPMVLSGYLIQVATEPLWRRIAVAVHLGTGILWVTGFLVHAFFKRKNL
jgi:hypothetical protein